MLKLRAWLRIRIFIFFKFFKKSSLQELKELES